MRQRLDNLIAEFPRQFWILFGGTLVNSIGGGMVFPFLTLYLHQRLNLSMTFVGVMLSLWAASALVGQLAGGSLTDQFGRKKLMTLSLVLSAVSLVAFGFADTVVPAAIITLLMGFVGALYQPARDAMVADLIETEKRPQAYGLVRVVHNLGIAIGPAIGGFLAARSYLLTFSISASATFVFFLVTLFLMRETKPTAAVISREADAVSGSFAAVFRDVRFIIFCAGATFVVMAAAQMMTVLPVYMKDQFGLGESFFGWVMTTNAGLVVLLQFPITRATEKLRRLPYLAVGALLYTLGVASVALGNTFPHFIVSMVVATLGEMIVVPTSTAITADLAPPEMRGRYMGMLGLTWTLGFGIGPILGGIIIDQIAPRALWPLMGSAALVGAMVYLILARFAQVRAPRPATPVA
jgi:MFS family permease